MCGRFTQYTPKKEIAKVFDYEGLFDLSPRYNIAPTQQVAVVGQTKEGTRKLAMLRWGMIPAWASDLSIGSKTFNARAETIRVKPSFRDSFMRRRCLIPASGFYEWDAQKTPVYFYPKYGSVFAFAGVWDSWKGRDGARINSCSVITTKANGLLSPLHDRMPAIIDSDYYSAWLDRDETDAGELSKLLEPYPAALMASHPVSKRVNSVKVDDELCAAPLNLSLLDDASRQTL